jgi:hypothetical protein
MKRRIAVFRMKSAFPPLSATQRTATASNLRAKRQGHRAIAAAAWRKAQGAARQQVGRFKPADR